MSRRSVLFTPGDQPSMLRNAPEAGADVVVFDLEDAVAPGEKERARETVRSVLSDPAFDPPCEVCVRVNSSAVDADADLSVVLDAERAPDGIVLPKTASATDVQALDRLVREHGERRPILALVETAAGVLDAPAIAAAEPTDAVIFGAEDLSADIGATRTDEGIEVLYARERIVLAASAAGIDAIDTVHTDLDDLDGLARETRFALQLGYDGKLAIHPAQIEPINAAFTPDPARVEWATRVLAARDRAANSGRGVFVVDDEMIDAPLIAQAERIVDRARAADRL